MPSPSLVLHTLAPSPPGRTVEAALTLKGLEFERIELNRADFNDAVEAVYGPGRRTVPGLVIDGEPVHGSTAILPRLDALVADPPLYPADRAEAIREAELWADRELQDLARRLPWGALHFRPEAMGSFGGAGPLDGPGTDFAIRYVHATWKYHKVTAARLAEDLAGLPGKLERLDRLVADGIIGADDTPNAADLQIGATVRVLLTVGDLDGLLADRNVAAMARRWFPEYPGRVPAGAFPAGWAPGPV